jgi:flagellar hook protein FlgE
VLEVKGALMRTLLISTLVAVSGCGADDSNVDVRWTSPTVIEQGCAPLGPEDFTQGALVTTGIPTDLAIDRAGFFVLRNGDGTWFTRDGRFTLDDRGRFLHVASGAALVGVDGEQLNLGTQVSPPQPTLDVTLGANLDAAAPAMTWDPMNPETSSVLKSSLSIFDAIGRAYAVDVFWTRVAPSEWAFHAMTRTGEVAWGALTFDANGRLVATTQSSNFIPPASAAPQPIKFALSVTQLAAPSETTFTGQDGAPAGQLATFSFDARGQLLATFTNGIRTSLGQVALAAFAVPHQLALRGNGLFLPTTASGQATIGPAGDGVHGSIVPNSLERLPVFSRCVVR